MKKIVCGREQEVLEGIAAGRWPDKIGEELAQHISDCRLCTDLSLVAQAFNEDYDSAIKRAHLPSAGLVWWRAEIRSRQDAIRTASRPITFVQGAAAAVGIGALLGLVTQIDFAALQNMSVAEWRNVIPDQIFPFHLLYLVIAIILVLAPIALYFVLSDD